MTNDILLLRHQRKLAVYFALFVLFSLWFAQGIFTISNYVTQNIRLIDKQETRVEGIKNILQNKTDYINKLSSSDTTLELVIEKSLEGVSLFENNIRILGDLDDTIFRGKSSIIFSQNSLYYQSLFRIGMDEYHVIIETPTEYSYTGLIRELFWFFLFSLPFSILFYAIGYFFVGRNLKPIDETIRSLEDFSSNLNHEIKTPLSEIISTLGLTKRTKSGYEEAIEQSLASASKITKILDSMKGLIRLVDASYKKERIDLGIAIREIIEEFDRRASEKHLELNTKFSSEPFVLKVNQAQLEIAVGNIMKNAIKYSNESGQIYISFEKGILRIQDFGVGISRENLENIFDRYFRENYVHQEGYGLGLALVKKIADLNGWKISITSEKGIGTTVTILFS